MSGTRIESVRYRVLRMRRREPFLIATGRSDSVVNVLIIIRTPDLIGLGVAAPNAVTGEDERSITDFLAHIAPRLEGIDALDMVGVWEVMGGIDGHPAAKAGVDASIHDIWGKVEGAPVFRILGGQRESMETFVTIGIMDLDMDLVVRGGMFAGGSNLEGQPTIPSPLLRAGLKGYPARGPHIAHPNEHLTGHQQISRFSQHLHAHRQRHHRQARQLTVAQ